EALHPGPRCARRHHHLDRAVWRNHDAGAPHAGRLADLQVRRHCGKRYPYARPMRRLLLLIYAVVFVDEMVLFALVPLVPSYRGAVRLSGFESGRLLATASAALVIGSSPGGLAGDRLGSRRVTLAGVALLALSCFAQGAAPGFWTLVAARLAFGLASAVVWSA